MTWGNQPLESATPIASDVSYLLEPYRWWQWVNLVTWWYPLNGFLISHYPGEGHLVQVLWANAKEEGLLYFRIRIVLACNAMFLSLSYSFRYRIIASYDHITASLTASESAICKESQWYESRVRVNEFLWILRVNWVVVCTFTAHWKVSVAVLLPQKLLIYLNSQLVYYRHLFDPTSISAINTTNGKKWNYLFF